MRKKRRSTNHLYQQANNNMNSPFVVMVNYNDILDYYGTILYYLTYHSDHFSLITHNIKPYSRRPPICKHDTLLEPLRPFLVRQLVGIQNWVSNEADDNHTVMNVYSSGKDAYRVLCTYENLFYKPDWNGLPEDLSFYRGNHSWFTTVTHEQLALLYWPTKDDLSFFQREGFRLRVETTLKPYPVFQLPCEGAGSTD